MPTELSPIKSKRMEEKASLRCVQRRRSRWIGALWTENR